MSMTTRTSLVGFIVSRPELQFTADDEHRCRARVGIERRRREADGALTSVETTFHDMVSFGKTARETWGRFRPGDRFIASGHIHQYEVETANGALIKEEFVARRIGHDATRTPYDLERRHQHASKPTNTSPESTPETDTSTNAPTGPTGPIAAAAR